MMQALANSPSTRLRAWVPVREKDSTSIPFDIAAERILLVDRADGKLDETSFADALRERVFTLVQNTKSKDD